MNIGEKIRTYRRNCNLTQKELGEKIGVSDKTISSWENSRTMPDFEMLSLLHHTLGLPIDFPSIESATESIEPTLPDEPLVNKKSYSSKQPFSLKKTLSFFLLVFCLVYLFLINYQYKNETIDRFNPFLKPQIGYTTLPVGYVENSIEHWVCNDIFGQYMAVFSRWRGRKREKPCCNQTQRKTRHERSPAHLGSHSLRLPRNPQPRL